MKLKKGILESSIFTFEYLIFRLFKQKTVILADLAVLSCCLEAWSTEIITRISEQCRQEAKSETETYWIVLLVSNSALIIRRAFSLTLAKPNSPMPNLNFAKSEFFLEVFNSSLIVFQLQHLGDLLLIAVEMVLSCCWIPLPLGTNEQRSKTMWFYQWNVFRFI